MAFARAVNTAGLSLVMSFLAIYVVETRGYAATTYGAIALVANLGQSLSNNWAGDLSDRIGRRPLITRALFVRAVFIALIGVQVSLHAPLWTLALNIVITSTLRGCFEPVAYALVADIVPDDRRVDAFSIQRIGTNLGWAIGPALGGALTLIIPYGYVFFFSGIGLALAGAITMRVQEPTRKAIPVVVESDRRGALREAWADGAMRMMLLGTLACALLETQMFSTFSIYMTDKVGLSKADVGLFYTCNGLGVLLLQVPALVAIKRFGLRIILPWASALDALAFALVGFAVGVPSGVLAIFAMTCAEVLFDPAQQAAIAEVADPARRGRTFGVVGFASMIGIAFAPLIGGGLLDVLGDRPHLMWGAIALFGVAQTACYVAFVRRRAALAQVQ